jgi:hypothetical protein
MGRSFKGRDFVFGNFLTISADLKILKQPNHVKHLRIFSTIFEILKTLPLKGWGDGEVGRWGDGEMGRWGDGENNQCPMPNAQCPLTTNH